MCDKFIACSKCNGEVPPDVKFCEDCGTVVMRQTPCHSCGNLLKPNKRFCGNCGIAVPVATVRRCGHCNEEVDKDAHFCDSCRLSIATPTSPGMLSKSTEVVFNRKNIKDVFKASKLIPLECIVVIKRWYIIKIESITQRNHELDKQDSVDMMYRQRYFLGQENNQ